MVLKKPASAGFLLPSKKRPADSGASWTDRGTHSVTSHSVHTSTRLRPSSLQRYSALSARLIALFSLIAIYPRSESIHFSNITHHMICRAVEHRLLLRIQWQLDHPHKPLLCQHTGHTHGNTCSPVLAFENRDRRQNAVSPIGDSIHHLCNCHARRIAGTPQLLQTQNLATTLTCALHNPLYLLTGQEVRQRHRTDRTVSHQRHHAIAMPSEHQRRDIPSRKPCLLGNETLHARCIQHPRLPEHPVASQPTERPSPIGQQIG